LPFSTYPKLKLHGSPLDLRPYDLLAAPARSIQRAPKGRRAVPKWGENTFGLLVELVCVRFLDLVKKVGWIGGGDPFIKAKIALVQALIKAHKTALAQVSGYLGTGVPDGYIERLAPQHKFGSSLADVVRKSHF
jgi:hypothetical protein